MNLYLIKRGPRPSYHNAPFHPIIICEQKRVAKWEAEDTNGAAWVWENTVRYDDSALVAGWLLSRWQGLDIDYGHVVKEITLPDGTTAAFEHDRERVPWTLMPGAIWWSLRKMPKPLSQSGVIYPPDSFTRDDICTWCLKGNIFPDGMPSTMGRSWEDEWPDFWPPLSKKDGS